MPNAGVGQRNVYKGRAVEAIDTFFNGKDIPLEQAYAYARGILGNATQSLADLTERLPSDGKIGLNADQVKHFRSHWPRAVQDEMRRGYTEAINLADGDPRLPIETFWVTGPSDQFKIFASRGTTQVTVLVFIPPAVEGGARRPT